MRYEAKHSYFKQLARVMGNFKNISKTLAGRHQHYMCYEMINPSSYMANRTTYTGGTVHVCTFILDQLYIQCTSTCTCIKYVMYHHDIHFAVKHVIVNNLEWSVEVSS